MSMGNKLLKIRLQILIIIAAVTLMIPMAAYADTDGSEIQVTEKPGQLILQLGSQWAGVKFQLKTGAGVFPVPVVVDADGVLRMEIGGSDTYILSCYSVGLIIPDPGDTAELSQTSPSPDESSIDADPKPITAGVPTGVLILFLVGLLAAAGGLVAMKVFKRRRDSYDYFDESDTGDDFDDEFGK